MKSIFATILITLFSISISFAITNAPSNLETKTKKQLQKLRKKRIKKLMKQGEDLVTNGKGTWVNIWNYPKDTKSFMARLKKYDIDTIYLQINRSNTDVFKHQEGLNKVLKAAHEEDIKVIGWSYCFLKNVNQDVKKFVEPALYKSPDGEMLDGMAADIEENISQWAVKAYTERIKKQLPKNYPLIAITFSPKIKSKYPWKYIAHNWDVIMPMTYWHGLKNRKKITVYNFVAESIKQIRELSEKEDVNIHLITDGDRTNKEEVAISLRAARDMNVNAGISIYPEHLSSDEMFEELESF